MTNNDHAIYIAEDISKYLSGKLSPAQMHAMEKEALDDPFFAEAIEGYEGMDKDIWQMQLATARSLLQEKENAAKVVPLYITRPKNNWRKAIAAVLIIGGAALTYKLINNKVAGTKEENIAKVTTPVSANNDTAAVVTNPVEIEHSPIVAIKPTDTKTNGTVTTTVAVPSRSGNYDLATKADHGFTYTPPAPVEKDMVISNIDAAQWNKDKFKAVDSNGRSMEYYSDLNAATNNAIPQFDQYDTKKKENNAEQAATTRKQAAPLNYNRSFLAQVVNTDNTALPFANISIRSENFGTYADVKGNFRLVSTDSLLVVEVRSVGFLPRTYTLISGAAINKITLSEDISAFGKTVIKENSTGKASHRATLLQNSSITVEPTDGWDNYNAYVSNNIDIPEDILKKDLHGEMEISFNIQPNGTISNVQVDKNNCSNCDEASVKKLIEQGPQWKLKKGKTGIARIKVTF